MDAFKDPCVNELIGKLCARSHHVCEQRYNSETTETVRKEGVLCRTDNYF